MKTSLLLSFIVCFWLLSSCEKEEENNIQPVSFDFEQLVASNYQTKIGTLLTFSAITSGEIASYEWISKDQNNNNYGTFFGGGSQVEWSVCHADSFYITCTVTGISSEKKSKTITIYVSGL